MNKPRSVILVILFMISLQSAWIFADVNNSADISYWTKARLDYAASAEFLPQWDTDSHRNVILSSHKDKQYDEVVLLGEIWLKKCPVDLGMHLVLADSYAGLNNKPLSDKHMQIYQALLGSIAASGNGASEDTAFSVISSAETHAIIQSLNGISPQYILEPSGVERVEFLDVQNKPHRMYFKYTKEYWDNLPS